MVVRPDLHGCMRALQLEPSCVAAHAGERAVRGMGESDMMSVALTALDMGEEEEGEHQSNAFWLHFGSSLSLS